LPFLLDKNTKLKLLLTIQQTPTFVRYLAVNKVQLSLFGSIKLYYCIVLLNIFFFAMLLQMKFSAQVLVYFLAFNSLQSVSSDCTHGRLFIADADSAKVYAYDIDGSHQTVLINTIETFSGLGPQYLVTSSTEGTVTAFYRGKTENSWQDGTVSFIRVGVAPSSHDVAGFAAEKEDPSLVDNFHINCTRPIHHVAHDQKIAIFCDGAFDDNINSTVWVVDERNFGEGEQPLVFTKELAGSHHGVVVPVDDNHVLVSVAVPERVAKAADSSALPDGFTVYDYDSQVLHGLNEVEDPSRSCLGFHGSGVVSNSFVFACDEDHGGLLVVDYGETVAYTSRALSYPDNFQDHRTGSLESSLGSELVVGNFADRGTNDYKLVVFSPKDQQGTIEDDQILNLDAPQCSFQFEKSDGEDLILVWMPTGNLRVYAIRPEWMLIADIQVIADMSSCDGTQMAAGQGHAYVMRGESLFDVVLHDLTSVEINTSSLGFTPSSAVVAGVPAGHACDAPPFPEAPATNAVNGWVSIDQDLAPIGSTAMAEFLLAFRNKVARSLNVGINRVFVEQTYKESGGSSVIHMLFSDPTQNDPNQERGEALLDQLMTNSLSAIGLNFVSVSTSAPDPVFEEEDPRNSSNDGRKFPVWATVGLSLVGAVIAIASAATIVFKKREAKALFDGELANNAQSA
jgi:hypothetical protein